MMDQQVPQLTVKRAKFIDVAQGRVNRTLKAIKLIAKLNNRRVYSYEDADIQKIREAIVAEADAMATKMLRPTASAGDEFKF